MTDQKRLTKSQEEKFVGMTARMYRDGKTPEEIALAIKQPIDRVRFWIGLYEKIVKEKQVK